MNDQKLLPEHTVPPCIACHAHDDLAEVVKDNAETNTLEHQGLVADIRWMLKIGYFMIVGILGLYGFMWKMNLSHQDSTIESVKTNQTVQHLASEMIKLANHSSKNENDIEECQKNYYRSRK